MLKFRQLIFIYVLIAIQAASVSSFGLHRFHTTLTRIDYNAEQKLFEISIQLFTHDLEALLRKRNGKTIDLEKTAEIDKLIFYYLNENFVLTDKKGETKTLKWVGKEFDADSIRVYLETDSTESLAGYKLKNTLFFESYPEQANLVVCRYDEKKADLLFKVGDKVKEINENKTSIEK
ncbi:MAG TPA: DUF6702 family protein [Pyrinomonadaceae bacterium]|nr:DUF6702 family protein [Pyrinomonadaceae bacterium]